MLARAIGLACSLAVHGGCGRSAPARATTAAVPDVAGSPLPERPAVARSIDPAPRVARVVDGPGRVESHGDWTVRIEPGAATASPGDEIAVAIHFIPRRDGAGEPSFGRIYGFAPDAEHVRERPIGRPELKLTAPEVVALPTADGFVVRGSAVIGASPRQLVFPVTFRNRQRPGSTKEAIVRGPRIELAAVPPPAEIAVDSVETRAPVELDLRASARTVTALVAGDQPRVMEERGRKIEFFCGGDRVDYEWVLRELDGRTVLFGFAARPTLRCCQITLASDHRPWARRVRFTVPRPGPVEVVIYDDRRHELVRTAKAIAVE